MRVLSALVEEARLRYTVTSKQNVTIYSVDSVRDMILFLFLASLIVLA